jgi:hypothetical protein
MDIQQRFLDTSFGDIVKYILKLEDEIKDKDNKIKSLIIDNTKLEVKLERYED